MLAGGFSFSEGPIWHPDGYLLFADMPNDVRRRWTEQDGVVEVMKPANECNGMSLDAELRLIVCEHTTSTVVRAQLNPDGTESGREVIASHYDGLALNSPNDVVVKSDGSIYFTDPSYGRMAQWNVKNPREQDLDFQGVYRIRPDGELQLLADDFRQPNGLCFSPDEGTLYVADSEAMLLRRFTVGGDGSLAAGEVLLAEIGSIEDTWAGIPDGMKCDELGNVWITGPGGIWVVSPEGEHLGTVEIPEHTGNLAWGGAGWDVLYVTAATSLYRFRTNVSGNRVPFMQMRS
jgi:gluconolactonase